MILNSILRDSLNGCPIQPCECSRTHVLVLRALVPLRPTYKKVCSVSAALRRVVFFDSCE